MLELLVDSGSDINAQNIVGDAPLHKAALNGRALAADFLIRKGANVNIRWVIVVWRMLLLIFCRPLNGKTVRSDLTNSVIRQIIGYDERRGGVRVIFMALKICDVLGEAQLHRVGCYPHMHGRACDWERLEHGQIPIFCFSIGFRRFYHSTRI